MIGKDGVKSELLEILAVKEFPQPQSSKNVKEFLGALQTIYTKVF